MLVKRHGAEQHQQDTKQIETLTNQLVQTTSDLDEQKKVANMLEKDIENKKKEYEKSLDELTNNIAQVSSSLAKAETNLQTAEQKMKEQDAKIADLESQNQALDKKAETLSNSITNLNSQIAETKHKLAVSEGDKTFLEKELKRLMADKAELERQFNDINVLRAQVAKLKEEQNIARRMEWMRQGIFASTDQKGAQQLIQGLKPAPSRAVGSPNYDLNVEVRSDGSVRVIPPVTNSIANPAPR
jgi:uncharacterized protein (DUF3084 family)